MGKIEYLRPRPQWRTSRRRASARSDIAERILAGAIAFSLGLIGAAAILWWLTPEKPRAEMYPAAAPPSPGFADEWDEPFVDAEPPQSDLRQERAYYPNCAAARAAGAAPIARGMPGYRRALDRDDDGWACEPYYRR